MITNKYHKIITVSYEDSGYLYFENISDRAGYFYPRLVRDWSAATKPNCEYSLNGVDWTTIDWTKYPYSISAIAWENMIFPGITVPSHSRIYLRGINSYWTNVDWGLAGFMMDVPYIIGGNILSLIDYQNMDSITTMPRFAGVDSDNGYSPFANEKNLISAEKMNFGNATTVSNKSLYGLFFNCSNMVKGPDMSKITTVGDSGMQSMFSGCTSLNSNVDLSSVTTVGNNGMQSMFSGCTSLTTAPDLSSITTVGSNGMRSMFSDCNNLLTSSSFNPSLTTVNTFTLAFMYSGCNKLVAGPDMSHITTVDAEGLRQCFRNCYNLEEATAPNVSTWGAIFAYEWLANAGRNVPAGTQKTVYCPTGVTIPTDSIHGIPTGWTRVDY